MTIDAVLLSLARRCGIEFIDDTAPTVGRCMTRDHLQLNYLDWGGQSDPIIFLHGGALTAHTWDLVCLGLRDRYRCVALDIRGHGDSDWADDYRIENAVDDVASLSTLVAETRCHVVGMSLGGTIAAHFAATYPTRVSSLTLVDIGPGVDFAASESIRSFVADTDEVDSLSAAIDAAMNVNPRADRDKVAYRLRYSMMEMDDGRFRWKQDQRKPHDYDHIMGKLNELPQIAARISCPVLVVRGERSRILTDELASSCASLFVHGEWTRIPDAGHNVQEDNPAALVDALMLFL